MEMEEATEIQYMEILQCAKRSQTDEFLQLMNKFRFSNDLLEQPDGVLGQVIQTGNAACLNELVKQGIDVTKFAMISCDGNIIRQVPPFPLNVLKNVSILKILLDNGADVNATNVFGRNALNTAIRIKSPTETIRLLLEHGSDVNLKDNNGNDPLTTATEAKSTEHIQILLEYGANINVPNRLGRTPLMISIQRITNMGSHLEIPKLLLEKGADANAKDAHQRSPLHYACSYKNPDVAQLLLEYGADKDSVDVSLQTPLMFSIFYCGDEYPDACHNVLLAKGSNYNLVDFQGHSVLHHAARCGRPDFIKELCERGIDVNLKSTKGYTPLVNSIQEKRVHCIAVLLSFGAELKVLQTNVNFIHETIMNHLQRHNTSKIVEMIYRLILVGGLQMDNQLPFSLDCQESKKLSSVPNLMQCSRLIIRQTVAKHNQYTNLFCVVNELPLPQTLKGFLLYDMDLTKIDYDGTHSSSNIAALKLA